jgi:uncharacterized protein involved in exopolysaccharide biosynthesis
MKNIYPTIEGREGHSSEINILGYINVVNKYKKLILLFIAVSVVATGIISLLSPKIYQATAIIMPADDKTNTRGTMSDMARRFGIHTDQLSDAAEIVTLLKSNILMEKVINKHNLLPVFFSKDKLEEMTESGKIWNGIRYLRDIYKINNNLREGVIAISVQFKDPKTSADIINYILTELTDYMSSEAKRVAETNREYLESLIVKNTDPLIQNKIYSLIAHQIEISMMAEVKENFAFKILDPPKTPDRKIKPKIRTNIQFSFAISLFFGIFAAFVIDYIGNIKHRETEKMQEGSTQ